MYYAVFYCTYSIISVHIMQDKGKNHVYSFLPPLAPDKKIKNKVPVISTREYMWETLATATEKVGTSTIFLAEVI